MKYTKELIGLVACLEYFEYCKSVKRETRFFHQGKLLNGREMLKILKSYEKSTEEEKNIKQWSKFVIEFGKIALEDEEWIAFKKDQFERCPECGVRPMKEEKCSKFHPEWHEMNKEWAKGKWKIQTMRQKCLECGYETFYGSGEDKTQNEGLRT